MTDAKPGRPKGSRNKPKDVMDIAKRTKKAKVKRGKPQAPTEEQPPTGEPSTSPLTLSLPTPPPSASPSSPQPPPLVINLPEEPEVNKRRSSSEPLFFVIAHWEQLISIDSYQKRQDRFRFAYLRQRH